MEARGLMPSKCLRDVLREAQPSWNERALSNAESKLGQVGINDVWSLAEALKAQLNERLSSAGLKTFNADTVRAFRNVLGVQLCQAGVKGAQSKSARHVNIVTTDTHAEVNRPDTPPPETHGFDFEALPDADEWQAQQEPAAVEDQHAPAEDPGVAKEEASFPNSTGNQQQVLSRPEDWDGYEWQHEEEDGDSEPAAGFAENNGRSNHAGLSCLQDNLETKHSTIADQWMSSRSTLLCEQLQDLENCTLSERRRRLRALQLELHPDKQPPELRKQAQQLFLMVQCEWEAVAQAWESRSGQTASPETPWEEQQRRRGEEDRQRHAAEARQRQEAWRRKEYEQGTEQKQEQEEKEEKEEEESEEDEDEETYVDGHWDENRFQQALFEFKRYEQIVLEKIKAHRRASHKLETLRNKPVILRIHYPLHPASVHGQHLWDFTTDRSQMIIDIKVRLEHLSGVKVMIQRLTLYEPNGAKAKDWTSDGNLEDLQLLSALPAGPILDLSLRIIPDPYADYIHMLKAVLRNWRMLSWAPSIFLGDRTMIRVAMRQNWGALRLATQELQSDRRLISSAIQQDGMALELAALPLRAERRLVSMAVKQNFRALKFASPELCASKDLILQAMKQDVDALEYAAPKLLDDRYLILSAVRQNPQTLRYASSRLRADMEIVRTAVLKDKKALVHAAPEIRSEMNALLAEKADTRQFDSWKHWEGSTGVLPSFEEYQKRLHSGGKIRTGFHKE